MNKSTNSTTTELDINPQFEKALDIFENTNTTVFLTGKAGTGKSTLLKSFIQQTKKSTVVLAPTGVAAINVGGETIHSFFGFKPGVTEKEAAISANAASKEKKKLVQELDTIIIDEISMVRADLLDYVDLFLKRVLKNQLPFGGKQMIFIGDLQQLPPIVSRDEKELFSHLYNSPFFFDSNVMGELMLQIGNFEIIELQKIYRQEDSSFVQILNDIRNNTITDADLETLNERVIESQDSFDDEHAIFVTARNADAQELNDSKLAQIREKEKSYDAEVTGQIEPSAYPAPFVLKLKVGARVMLLNNDSAGRWINGSLGTVTKLDKDEVTVALDEGDSVRVLTNTWEVLKSVVGKDNKIEKETIGSFTQFPLKLAWAITIHKSQGKTFEKIVVDLGWGAFAEGQTYVALSRATALEGVFLKKPIKQKDIRTDNRVIHFIQKYKEAQVGRKQTKMQKKALLKKAIEQDSKVQIVYKNPDGAIQELEIAPVQFFEFEHGGKTLEGIEIDAEGGGEKMSLGRIVRIE